MGAWFQSILVRTEDPGPVRDVLRHIAMETDVKFLAGPAINGWMSVFPSEIGGPAEILAQRANCDIFHLQVHDDDVFCYDFYRGGKLIDRYNSYPDCFDNEDGEHLKDNEPETVGRPELFQDLLPNSSNLGQLKAVLDRNWEVIFENERMSEFAELLGLENALSSYKYLQSGETDGIDGWEQFVHIEEQPVLAEDFCRRGVWKREAQDYLGALEDLNRALMLKPEMSEGYLERAHVHEDLRLVVGRLEQQLDSPEISARRPTILKELSFGSEQSNLEAALRDYETAIALAPDYVDALIGRARLKREIKDLDGAMRDYNRIIELRPDIAITWNHRGRVKRKQKDLNGAIADFSHAIELEPGNADFYNNRGLARKGLGDLAGALADMDRSIELNPQKPIAYFNRALVRHGQKDVKGALADLDKAISLSPDAENYYQIRGNLRRAAGDTAGALEDYNKALDLQPGFADAETRAKRGEMGSSKIFASRADAHRSLGNYVAAIADCNNSLEIEPDVPQVLYIRGEAKRQSGDLNGAIADFDRAAQLKPDSAMIHNSRGMARQAKGDFAGAVADFKRACEIKPDWAPARDNLNSAMRAKPQ